MLFLKQFLLNLFVSTIEKFFNILNAHIFSHFSNKYSEKLLHSAKKFATDSIKTASKKAIQKYSEATVDLIGNKIAHKIKIISKSPKEFH